MGSGQKFTIKTTPKLKRRNSQDNGAKRSNKKELLASFNLEPKEKLR